MILIMCFLFCPLNLRRGREWRTVEAILIMTRVCWTGSVLRDIAWNPKIVTQQVVIWPHECWYRAETLCRLRYIDGRHLTTLYAKLNTLLIHCLVVCVTVYLDAFDRFPSCLRTQQPSDYFTGCMHDTRSSWLVVTCRPTLRSSQV